MTSVLETWFDRNRGKETCLAFSGIPLYPPQRGTRVAPTQKLTPAHVFATPGDPFLPQNGVENTQEMAPWCERTVHEHWMYNPLT